jgi:hypothetical protein
VSLVHLINLLGLAFNKFLAKDQVEVQPRNEAELTLLYRTDGFPLLPAINFDTISPTSGRPLLTAYILGVWGKYWQFLMFQLCFNLIFFIVDRVCPFKFF